jgi:hypothetical protein
MIPSTATMNHTYVGEKRKQEEALKAVMVSVIKLQTVMSFVRR